MPHLFRRLAATLAIAGLVLGLASPSLAEGRLADVGDEQSAVPMIFDIAVMRPIGLTSTIIGSLFYVFPVLPIMAITRPSEIGKPLGPLVGAPARFTFKDPIGHHAKNF